MAENVKGPIGVNTLHREKLSCPENEDDGEESILRVISRKSVRDGEEVKWTEEVKKLVSPRKSVNSAVTIVQSEEDDRGWTPVSNGLILGPIAFDLNDPLDPKSWSEGKKWYISFATTIGGSPHSSEELTSSVEFDVCFIGPVRGT